MSPYLPKLRAQACKMVRVDGKGVRETARYFGVQPGTISKWLKKYPEGGAIAIRTVPSRPKSHPKAINKKIIERIVEMRKKHGRCAEVIHQELKDEGVRVSLSSVKRILDRKCLTKKKSPWKRHHKNFKRPYVALPGDLVQMDTIHLMQSEKKRIYIYTLIDLHSRWTHAVASEKIGALKTAKFVKRAQRKFPHQFVCLQSDHGPEFSQTFTEHVKIAHRHSRVRRPNDNAHIERFNRTLQEEFLDKLPRDVKTINRHLPEYLKYYNEERLHMGIEMKKPIQML